MLLSIGFISLVVALEAGPAYRIILAETRGFPLDRATAAQAALHFGGVVLLSAACFYLPMRLGPRSLERLP